LPLDAGTARRKFKTTRCAGAVRPAIQTEGVAIMNVGPIQSYMIENKSDADEYLSALFEKPEYKSMDEVHTWAAKYIKDQHLKDYFINKANEMLKS
jgi:hypothetical protein